MVSRIGQSNDVQKTGEHWMKVSLERRSRTSLMTTAISLALVLVVSGCNSPSVEERDTDSEKDEQSQKTNSPPNTEPVYYTSDGTDPSSLPNCTGLFGLCLNAPIERVLALFGTETS